jgi:hypothetical protein
MKLYDKKLIKNQVNRQIRDRQELRDAIVIDTDTANRYCRVKIQGSDKYITAYYPENWEATPAYLKPGNVVRITHPGGNKGRIEVSGHGILLPTPIVGGSMTPTPIVPEDAVITGCELLPASPNAMKVMVNSGTLRIGGIIYTLSGMVMDRADIIMDRPDLILDMVGDTVSFDPASGIYFRYDSVVAGSDGIAHVVKGSDFLPTGTILLPPVAPTGHVVLGWVLIYPNMTVITAGDINRVFSSPTPSELRATVADGDLTWGQLSTTITVVVYDQYGNSISFGETGYRVTFAWVRGNGTLSYGSLSQDESASFSFYMTASAVVTYTRDAVDPGDLSPTFEISEGITGLSNAASIMLYDAAGSLMIS